MHISAHRLSAALLFVLLPACSSSTPPKGGEVDVTLSVVNARIWTGDFARPWAEAMAASGDRLVAVGTNAEIRALAAASPSIDAEGRLVLPGFIDAHVHFLQGGFDLASVQLRDADTPQVFAGRIRAFAATLPDGVWITGGNWDHERWGGELPRKDWIDADTPNHPVMVSRLDGHMVLANSAAMRAAGIGRATKDVEGGTIVRDSSGDPTGIFKDNAMSLFDGVVPDPSPDQQDRALDAAMRYVAAQGVTSVDHMGGWSDLDTFRRAHDAETLRTRIYAAVPLADWARLRDLVGRNELGADGRGDHWLRIGALKGFVDGSLGSHTAAFEQPFTDAPRDRGFFVNTPEDLYTWISAADKAGLHVVVHAIGDRANAMLLDTYARVEQEDGPRDRRFRIEHAQHLAAPDIPRFAALGVIPSMQPYHAIDDGRWAEKVIGPERIKTTYAFRSLLDARARLAFGSDWPVAPATPIEGIYAAVTRRTLDDRHPDGWVPEQRITVEEAVRAYTAGAAYAEFSEADKGRLTPGLLADFVILDRDLFSIPPEEIRQAQVTLTVVGGRVVYEKGATATDGN
jgi:predicted amidohydrolase YtcJ